MAYLEASDPTMGGVNIGEECQSIKRESEPTNEVLTPNNATLRSFDAASSIFDTASDSDVNTMQCNAK